MTPEPSSLRMQDSGIEWVGPIPSHWRVLPFYSFADEVSEVNIGLKERNLLSLSYGRIIRKDIDRLEGLTPASFEGYNVIEANDIVFRLTDLQNDQTSLRSARATERGIITSAYVTVRPRSSPRFFDYLMRAYDTTKVFYGIGGGIRQSMKYADLKRLPVVVPPASEMEKIASYLDRATARIDALVAKKTHFIQLLRERRQALISAAITRGIHDNVRLVRIEGEWAPFRFEKDRYLWSVERPLRWKSTRLRFISRLNPTDELQSDVEEGSFLPMETVGEEGSVNLERTINIRSAGSSYSWFRDGDIAVAKVTPCFENGKGAPLRNLRNGIALASSELANIRPFSNVDQEFLYFLTVTYQFRKGGAATMTGAGGLKRVSNHFFKDLTFAIPGLDEQREIVCWMKNRCSKIDSLILKTERSIELLREHRTALITSAVTGRIDLR